MFISGIINSTSNKLLSLVRHASVARNARGGRTVSCVTRGRLFVCSASWLSRQHGSRHVGQRGRRPEQEEEKTASPLVFFLLFVVFVVRQPRGQQPEPKVQSPEPLSLQRPRQEVTRASEPHLNSVAVWVQTRVLTGSSQVSDIQTPAFVFKRTIFMWQITVDLASACGHRFRNVSSLELKWNRDKN